MSDIFISYSSKDKNIAQSICSQLEQAKLKCWMAPRDIKPGEEYASGIIRGINNCQCMVVIFSDNSNASRHVLSEVESAFSKSKIIVPFRIADVMPSDSMEYFLKVAHWLDASSSSLDNAIADLAETLAGLLKQDYTPLPPTATAEKTNVGTKKRGMLIGAGVATALAILAYGIFEFAFESSPTGSDDIVTQPAPPVVTSCTESFEQLISGNAQLLNQASKQNLESVNGISCLLPNRAISVKAWVEPNRSQFMAGDSVSFKVSLDKDAYLAVYVHSVDGSSYLIYPNSFASLSRIPAEQVFTVGNSRGKFELEIAEPFGLDVVQFIASNDQQEFTELLQERESINGTEIFLAERDAMTETVKGINTRGIKVTAAKEFTNAEGKIVSESEGSKKLWGETLILLNTRPAE